MEPRVETPEERAEREAFESEREAARIREWEAEYRQQASSTTTGPGFGRGLVASSLVRVVERAGDAENR